MKTIDNYPECALQTMSAPGQQPARALVPAFSPGWYWARIIIRVSILLIAACICALLVLYRFLGLVILPLLISDMAWQSSELVALAIRRKSRRGIHPAAHLAADLAHLLAYLAMATSYRQLSSTTSAADGESLRIAWKVMGPFFLVQWYVPFPNV